jgi:hypothetical protein
MLLSLAIRVHGIDTEPVVCDSVHVVGWTWGGLVVKALCY